MNYCFDHTTDRWCNGLSVCIEGNPVSSMIGGNWSAVLSGENTVYQSGSVTLEGPVTLVTGATLTITSGAVVSGLTNSTDGTWPSVYVSSGGTLTDSLLNNTIVHGSAGGVVQNNLYGYSYEEIQSGGFASGDVRGGGGDYRVMSGGTVASLTVNDVTNFWVDSGGTSYDTTLNSGSTEIVRGAASGTKVNSGATQLVSSGGGNAVNTNIGSGGSLVVLAGGSTSGAIVSSGATAVNQATAFQSGNTNAVVARTQNTTILSGGVQWVGRNAAYSPTYYGGVEVSGHNSGGILHVEAGGTTISETIDAGGTAIVNNSGTMSGSLVSNGGVITASAWQGAGYVIDTNVGSGGTVVGSAGAIVQKSTVKAGGSLVLSSGATGYNNQIDSGGTGVVQIGGTEVTSNGTTSGLTVFGTGWNSDRTIPQGNLIVKSGGTAYNAQISGGYLSIADNSAVSVSAHITNGGWQDVGYDRINSTSGGTAIHTILEGGARQFIFAANSSVDTQVYSGSIMDALSGAAGVNAAIFAGGAAVIRGGATLSGGTVASGGQLIVSANGLLGGTIKVQGVVSGGTVITNGLLELLSGGTTTGQRVLSGGSLQIDAGGKLSGLISLDAGAAASLDTGAGGTINLGGAGYTNLNLTGQGDPTTVISGFNGASADQSDRIVLAGIPPSDILGVSYPDADHVSLHLKDGTIRTLNIIGVRNYGYDISESDDGSAVYAVCFLKGTMISTPQGEQRVEDLRPGDIVCVYQGANAEPQLVEWVGQKHVTRAETATFAADQFPVRILAGAFSENTPSQDLLITPEHCVFIDECLIPVRMLVNGKTIYHDSSLEEFSYYHIETETHSILQSNGLLSESYLNTGNKRVLSLDNDAEHGAPFNWRDHAVARLNTEQSFVEPIWMKLAERAQLPGDRSYNGNNGDDVYLVDENTDEIRPTRISGNQYVFNISADIKHVYLCSSARRPCDVYGPYVDDRRVLGLCVGRIDIFDSLSSSTIDVDNFLYEARGWYRSENSVGRWTNGKGVVPLPPASIFGDRRVISFQVVSRV